MQSSNHSKFSEDSIIFEIEKKKRNRECLASLLMSIQILSEGSLLKWFKNMGFLSGLAFDFVITVCCDIV